MKKSRFTEAQIIGVLRQAEGGLSRRRALINAVGLMATGRPQRPLEPRLRRFHRPGLRRRLPLCALSLGQSKTPWPQSQASSVVRFC